MQVPLFDIQPSQSPIVSEIRAAAIRVIDSGQYILGTEVARLEKAMAEYCRTQFAVGVSSGTDALLIALMALGVKEGDLILVSSFSFFATAGVVARLGARPVFVDIDPYSFNITGVTLQAAWDHLSPDEQGRVRAVIPVHLYGQCADMQAILEFSERTGISVIEDAAQAIGAEIELKPGDVRSAGSIGIMGCFSFYPTKNLGAAGDAGCVTTTSQLIENKLRVLRNHGASQVYIHHEVGGNFRIDAMQAAILNVKMPHVPEWNIMRQQNAVHYDELLDYAALDDNVTKPHRINPSLKNGHTFHQYVIRVRHRDALQAHLKIAGVGTAIYYPLPLHLQPCFANEGYREGDLPISEIAAKDILALPIYPGLTREQQNYVIQQIASFYHKR